MSPSRPRPSSSPAGWSRSWAPAPATWSSRRTSTSCPGICGYVEDGILPGFFGYEAGQSCVGDHFAWFVEHAVPARYTDEARDRGIDIHVLLQDHASRLRPGESGLLALDWWNGNRSVLVDVELGGLLIGATLATTAPEIYRALVEATAYGTRVIIEALEANGVPVNEVIAAGGLAGQEPADHADLRRRHRAAVPAQRLRPDAGPRVRDVRRRRGRAGGRRLRHDRGRQPGDGPPQGPDLRARPRGDGGV